MIFVNYLKLVVRNTTVGKSPLAVATVVTQDQSTTSITTFFQQLRDDLKRNFNIRKIRPKMIIMDGSIVLLKSMLTFVELSISQSKL